MKASLVWLVQLRDARIARAMRLDILGRTSRASMIWDSVERLTRVIEARSAGLPERHLEVA